MAKIKIGVSGIFYPVSIMMYFIKALEMREDVELVTCGIYTGTEIPWNGGMKLPEKYALPPTYPLSKHLLRQQFSPSEFLHGLDEFKDIDIWIQVDSTWAFSSRPPCDTLVTIATDPHVIPVSHYNKAREISDFFFNMQRCYSQPGDIYLPYAASKYHHFPIEIEPEYDVCLVGLQYPERTNLVNALRANGISVHYELGLGPDEYREAYNRSRVTISWSSKDDLIARVFEAGAMKLPLVSNMVPDLNEHFTPGIDLLAFDNNVPSAVNLVKHCLENEVEAFEMAHNMYESVMRQHTYDHRIQQILDTVGA